MSAEGTKIPNPISRLVEVLSADGNDTIKLGQAASSAVFAIGGALAAAGVAPAAMNLASTIGALTVDPNLPNLNTGAGIQRA